MYRMDQTEPVAFPTRYQFPRTHHIRVQWRGGSRETNETPATDDSWAITDIGNYCLNQNGEWEYEAMPSSRTEAFIKRCRFPLAEALRRAAPLAAQQADEDARLREAAKRMSHLPEGEA